MSVSGCRVSSLDVRVELKWAFCHVVPWSLEGHAVSPLPCEAGHACALIYFFILMVMAGITNVFCFLFVTCRMSFFCSLTQPQTRHIPFLTAPSLPYYFSGCLSFTCPLQKAMHSQLPSWDGVKHIRSVAHRSFLLPQMSVVLFILRTLLLHWWKCQMYLQQS